LLLSTNNIANEIFERAATVVKGWYIESDYRSYTSCDETFRERSYDHVFHTDCAYLRNDHLYGRGRAEMTNYCGVTENSLKKIISEKSSSEPTLPSPTAIRTTNLRRSGQELETRKNLAISWVS
jgi:hypothetical protein